LANSSTSNARAFDLPLCYFLDGSKENILSVHQIVLFEDFQGIA